MIDYTCTFPTLAKHTPQNKTVLVRVDFNVKLDQKGFATDYSRIRLVVPTIELLRRNGNKIILMTHFGRPEGKQSEFSTERLLPSLAKVMPSFNIKFCHDPLDGTTVKQCVEQLTADTILVLENLRFYPQESANDAQFARHLADLADVYVNDAFGVSHRRHASVVGIVQYIPSLGGLLLEKEVQTILGALLHPKRPLVTIVGGAKISTKLQLLSALKKKADSILVGGGLANTLFKAQGYDIGGSIVEEDRISEAHNLLMENASRGTLVIPTDVRYGRQGLHSTTSHTASVADIPANACILDIGPATEKMFHDHIASAGTIVWNGPVGLFETKAFRSGTDHIYDSIISNEKAESVVGGGDTLAAIAQKSHLDRITHISTGGGAMLELLEMGTLPGIDALEHQK